LGEKPDRKLHANPDTYINYNACSLSMGIINMKEFEMIVAIVILVCFTAYCLYASNDVYKYYKKDEMSGSATLMLISFFNLTALALWIWVLSV